MDMTKVTATEMKNRFGKYLDTAQQHPISIVKSGREMAVLISHQRYEELQALEDRYWVERTKEAEESGYIGPEETMEFLTKGLMKDEKEVST